MLIPIKFTSSYMHNVSEHNYAILSKAFKFKYLTLLDKNLFPPSHDILLQLYMQNSSDSGCLFQCIHIKHASWAPVYCSSYLTFGVVWIWTLWCVHQVLFLWMLHRSFPFTCCFASVVTSWKLTGFVWRCAQWVNDSVLRINFGQCILLFF